MQQRLVEVPTDRQVRKYAREFCRKDADGDGLITVNELHHVLAHSGLQAHAIAHIMALLGCGSFSPVSFSKFVGAMHMVRQALGAGVPSSLSPALIVRLHALEQSGTHASALASQGSRSLLNPQRGLARSRCPDQVPSGRRLRKYARAFQRLADAAHKSVSYVDLHLLLRQSRLSVDLINNIESALGVLGHHYLPFHIFAAALHLASQARVGGVCIQSAEVHYLLNHLHDANYEELAMQGSSRSASRSRGHSPTSSFSLADDPQSWDDSWSASPSKSSKRSKSPRSARKGSYDSAQGNRWGDSSDSSKKMSSLQSSSRTNKRRCQVRFDDFSSNGLDPFEEEGKFSRTSENWASSPIDADASTDCSSSSNLRRDWERSQAGSKHRFGMLTERKPIGDAFTSYTRRGQSYGRPQSAREFVQSSNLDSKETTYSARMKELLGERGLGPPPLSKCLPRSPLAGLTSLNIHGSPEKLNRVLSSIPPAFYSNGHGRSSSSGTAHAVLVALRAEEDASRRSSCDWWSVEGGQNTADAEDDYDFALAIAKARVDTTPRAPWTGCALNFPATSARRCAEALPPFMVHGDLASAR